MKKKKIYHKRLKLTKEERKTLSKNKRQGFKIPKSLSLKIKNEYLKKYNVNSFQRLFDYLIVSGLVFLKLDIIELVRKRIPEFQKKYTKKNLAKLNKQKIESEEIVEEQCVMYEQDFQSFGKLCVEENFRKFWAIQILFEEFVADNQVIIDHIKRCQELKTEERKKQISRLSGDEYVFILPEEEANKILEIMTERYDNKQFGGQIGQALDDIFKSLSEKVERQEETDKNLEKKAERIKRARQQQAARARAIIVPIDRPEDDA